MNYSDTNRDVSDDEPGGCRKDTLAEQSWHAACKHSLNNIDDLIPFIPLNDEERNRLAQVVRAYQMRIPLYYLSLIKNIFDPDDPIRKQCMPSVEEINENVHEHIDPLGEEKTSPNPYLVHRYPDRALLLVTGRCFMYCRHCTRKRLWKINCEPTLNDIEKSSQYLSENKEIREVIVSGGDPLTLSTERLDHILSLISRIENIEVIRIGTRAPVVLPQRIDDNLCRMLQKYNNLWINIQFNHPREVTPDSESACRKLQRRGIPLSNQSVLLKGINDDIQVMKDLCHKLQKIRVRPYYLFQCDPVVGASHFRTPVLKGVEIVEKMRGYTSGMCIPTFVVDGTDGFGKVSLQPEHLVSKEGDCLILKGYKGDTFKYYNPRE